MESAIETQNIVEKIPELAVRYKGRWYKITPKKYEPERQTYAIAWKMIKQGISPEQAYREWFAEERETAKLLYSSFGKNE
jgi:hypothetical protein